MDMDTDVGTKKSDVKADFRILIIDDNPAIHHDFQKILTSNHLSNLDELSKKMFGKKMDNVLLPHFQIDTASQGQEGLEKIKQAVNEKNPYSLAFVDIRMPPGWDGIETIKHIWEVDKDIQIVICTAYSDYSWEETVAHLGKTDNLLVLKKPFDNVSVRQLACALTKKWQLLQDTRQFTYSLKKQINDRTKSLEQSLSLVKATLESSDEGIIVIDNNDNIIDFNHKFCSMWDIPLTAMANREKSVLQKCLIEKIVNPSAFFNWFNIPADKITETGNIEVIHFKDGKTFDCYAHPQILDNKIVGRVFNFRDITKRAKLENDLQYQATHDALTSLPNRVLLLDKIRDAIKTSEKSNTMFAVLFLDLDRFKLINDSLGHAAGDELLLMAAKRIQSITRSEDTLARLGGDEFVVILTNIKSADHVSEKAEKIIKAFQEPFNIFDRTVAITCSIGISLYPRDGKNVDMLLRNADACMYHAKELGSNNFKFYTKEMNEKILDKLEHEMQLYQALQNNEFCLYYQPQYDLNSEKLIAVEALLRWNHPKKGLLLPIDFVPIAEETGLIVPIGEWVLKTACQQNKTWQDKGFPPIRIAVNITAQQLKQPNIVNVVQSVLNETGLKAEYLELELTENIIISSVEVIKTTERLKKLGITIAIDDFGTGYSSLSYLKKLPLDRLKIDGSFIKNIKTDGDDDVIVRAIIAVAKNLDLDVLAEGVENKNQLEFLRKQNCTEIQGYLYSKPLSTDKLEKLFEKYFNKEG